MGLSHRRHFKKALIYRISIFINKDSIIIKKKKEIMVKERTKKIYIYLKKNIKYHEAKKNIHRKKIKFLVKCDSFASRADTQGGGVRGVDSPWLI